MDLNLLMALDALLEDNSVVGAARRLHLTPPAVSRTLARIRHVTGDDILVRSGRMMLPTPYALSIRQQVRALVHEATSLLKPGRQLDLASLERVFTLRGHDALLGALAPALIVAAAETAPGVRFRFLGEVTSENQDMMRNEVDLELGSSESAPPEIVHELIGADRLVLAMRRGHPLTKGRLTSKRLAAALHVTVSRRGRLQGPADAVLAEAGLARRVVASLPTSAAALEVVGGSDIVAIVAETLCHPACKAFGVVTRPMPFELPSAPVVMAWHRRFDSDAGHAWMRQLVGETLDMALATGTA